MMVKRRNTLWPLYRYHLSFSGSQYCVHLCTVLGCLSLLFHVLFAMLKGLDPAHPTASIFTFFQVDDLRSWPCPRCPRCQQVVPNSSFFAAFPGIFRCFFLDVWQFGLNLFPPAIARCGIITTRIVFYGAGMANHGWLHVWNILEPYLFIKEPKKTFGLLPQRLQT